MTQKEIAIHFLNLVTSGEVKQAYDAYIHPKFRHHNAYFLGDRDTLLKGMEESAERFPSKLYQPIRALEDGDLVAVHGRLLLNPDGPEFALVHIFRFQDGSIIEEWECFQEVPEDSPNENGVF